MWSSKLRLLCWKNWILVKRHYIQACIEIIFPIVIVLIFTYVRDEIQQRTVSGLKFPSFKPFNADCSFGSHYYFFPFGKQPKNRVGYAPNDEFHKSIMQSVQQKFQFDMVGLENGEELRFWIRNESMNNAVAAIEFDSEETSSKHLKYSIRLPQDAGENVWFTDQIYYISPSRTSRLGDLGIPYIPPYHTQCFVGFQNEIDRAFITLMNATADVPQIFVQAFPYPTIVEDMFLQIASATFPLLFVLSMILSVKNIIKNVTVEIETSLKESMKMMGLSSAIHWSSWFIKCFIMMIIPFTINVIIMCSSWFTNRPMFYSSSAIIIWFFFIVYITSVVTFGFLMSVLFKKSSTAGNFGSLFFFFAILPYNYFNESFHSMPYVLKAFYCMIVNTNMGQAMKMILGMESNEQGVRFSNLFYRDIDMKFSFGELLIFMILGSIIHLILTNYIERVFPGEFGIAQPCYYPLKPLLNFLKKRMGYRTLANESILQERKVSNPDVEDEPNNFKVGIKITNLSKRFGDFYAVNKLSLNMYENQITVLLGHNGAGKTTLMSMLVGLFSPTSGTAYLNGKDIRTEINEARASVGICPQHNVLFEELTVKEHLMFFCALKGMEDKRMIAEDARKYISMLDLKDKANAESRTLSGGMKRKLSIAIALCGNAKIVVMDEPTSGIDVEARRHLWDLLIAEKNNRTILLSTHYMDEADVLGDRIAIMTQGRLRTVGSSFFLKKKFGTGYRLTCVKMDGFQSEGVLRVIEKYTSDVYLESEGQTEAAFIISENNLQFFEQIFKELEDNSEKLHIRNFGCSLTTLEEVFLKLGVESVHNGDEIDGHARSAHSEQSQILIGNQEEEEEDVKAAKVTGFSLILYQIEATILKKFHVFRRSWKQFFSIGIFSAWMIFVLMSANEISFGNINPLKISFESYRETVTVLEGDNSLLSKAFAGLFDGKKNSLKVLSDGETISKYILKKSNESLATVNKEYMIGAKIKNNVITAWFNGQPYHTLPLTINTINRALLKNAAGNDFDITVSNYPYTLPIRDSDGNRNLFEDPKNVILALAVFYILLTFWPVIFVAPYIKERETRAKLLQYISGMNRFVFWITSFIFDYIVFFLICTILIGIIGAFQRPHFSTLNDLLTIFLIAMNYGFSFLPFIYAFSYLFTKFSTGESILSLLSIIFAIIYGVVRFMEIAVDNELYKVIVKIVYWILLLFAPFAFTDQLTKLGMSFLTGESILTFNSDGIGWNIVMSFVSVLLFMSICLLKDHMLFVWFYYKFLSRRSQMLPIPNPNIDSDVRDEVDKVKSMQQSQIRESNLVLQGLTKYYGNFLAVNQLYIDVEQRECFGLLGINGAGKTSAFKMMTGDEYISAGDGWVRGYSMKNQMNKVHQSIGYTPQFDAVLPELTGYETLKIFSLIRGIPRCQIEETINLLANEFGFAPHLKKPIKAFSGGNKRKLSTSLAILGNPQLIFLDEPTNGVDPEAKHHMWNAIKKIRDSGRAVVITSHSMDECESLCTKLGIMVSGEFKCLGSVQYLKNKYSKGFILTIKIGRDDEQLASEIQNRVCSAFNLAELKEKYLDIMTFHITNLNLRWSQVFGICAELKEQLNVQDYALSQMSLEQVFLIFSKSGIYQQQTAAN